MFAQKDIEQIRISPTTGTIEFDYKKEAVKKSFRATPGEINTNPLKRIPLFNVLKSQSDYKPIVSKYLEIYLGWSIEFKGEGHINIVEETNLWRRNLKLTTKREVSMGFSGHGSI